MGDEKRKPREEGKKEEQIYGRCSGPSLCGEKLMCKKGRTEKKKEVGEGQSVRGGGKCERPNQSKGCVSENLPERKEIRQRGSGAVAKEEEKTIWALTC